MLYITNKKSDVDVLLCIEHRDRELDIACALANELEKNNLNVAICSTIFHPVFSLLTVKPKIVITPSTAFGKGSIGELFYSLYGGTITFINLNYEQFISSWKGKYKTSAHPFSRENQIQLVWGEYFKSELIKNGTNEDNIYITGRPSLELVKNKYSCNDKSDFSISYPAHHNKRVCFIALTDGLAFVSELKIKNIVDGGANKEGLIQHIEYVKKNMHALFKEIAQEAEKHSEVLFVLRPHPSVPEAAYYELFIKLGIEISPNILVTKDENAFWWLSKSDLFVTNYSTLCLESKVLNVNTYIYEKFESSNVEDYWYTSTALKCNSLTEILQTNEELNLGLEKADFFIDFDKEGIFETAKVINGLSTVRAPVKQGSLLKVIFSNKKKLLGSIIRNIYSYTGIRPFDRVSRGLINDFFTAAQVSMQKDVFKNEI